MFFSCRLLIATTNHSTKEKEQKKYIFDIHHSSSSCAKSFIAGTRFASLRLFSAINFLLLMISSLNFEFERKNGSRISILKLVSEKFTIVWYVYFWTSKKQQSIDYKKQPLGKKIIFEHKIYFNELTLTSIWYITYRNTLHQY